MVDLKEKVVFLPYENAYSLVLEASPEASKTRSLRFVDRARSVLYLRARVVLAPISKGAYALYSLSTKRAFERAGEAFHLVASPLFPHPTLPFPLKLPRFVGLIDWIPENHNLS